MRYSIPPCVCPVERFIEELTFTESLDFSLNRENTRKSGIPVPVSEVKNASPLEKRWDMVRAYILKNVSIRNSDLCRMLGVSSATANRLLSLWTDDSKLERYSDGRTWAYRLIEKG